MNPRSTPKRIIALLALVLTQHLAIAQSNSQVTPPPSEITAPDKGSRISIEHRALPGSDPVEGFFTLVLSTNGRAVREVPTMGYLLDAFWSSDNRYLAVNNRRSNAGDYLWVFSLPDGQVLEAPNERLGELLAQKATAKFPELANADFDRFSNVAKGWTSSGELKVESRIVFHRPNAAVVRHSLYGLADRKFVLRNEYFEKIPSP
jgi:hypothetical protein